MDALGLVLVVDAPAVVAALEGETIHDDRDIPSPSTPKAGEAVQNLMASEVEMDEALDARVEVEVELDQPCNRDLVQPGASEAFPHPNKVDVEDGVVCHGRVVAGTEANVACYGQV